MTRHLESRKTLGLRKTGATPTGGVTMKAILMKTFLRRILTVVLFAMSAGAQANLQGAINAYAGENFPVAL